MPPDDKCIIVPERDCIGKTAALKLEARIDALEAWQKDSKEFHHAFYDWQREQIARDSKLDEKLLPSGRYDFTFENFIKGNSND